MADLRKWIKEADDSNILRRIKEETDLRRVSGILNENRIQPVLFENLLGYDVSFIGQTISSPALAAFALGVENSVDAVTKEYAERVSNFIEPKYIDLAPCQEVIKTGSQVDLTELPLPLQHTRDGSVYISAGVQMTKSPGTYVAPTENELNLGCYRHMLYTKDVMGIDFVSAQRNNVFYKKLMEEGKPLEMAIMIGLHPLTLMASVVPNRDVERLGGLLREPVELVPCKTIDLHVLASAEIIIEGELPPIGWTVPEGPYGEFTGYQSARKNNPVFKVKAITYRKNPIFQTATIGTRDHATSDTANIGYAGSLQTDSAIESLRSLGFDVKDISRHMGFTIISMKKWFEGQARSLIYRYGSLRSHFPKFFIVVDDDIDIHDPVQISWALSQRCRPEEDIIIQTGIPAKPLDPSNYYSHYNAVASRMGIDATKPLPPYAERWEFIESTVPFEEEIEIGRKVAREGDNLELLKGEILSAIQNEPIWFFDILTRWSGYEHRSIVVAMTELNAEKKIIQNDIGQWEYQ